MSNPLADGFSMPAEWVPHERCWMAWPSRAETWGEHLDGARDVVAEIANTIARFEPVTIVTKPKNVAEVSLLTAQRRRAGFAAARRLLDPRLRPDLPDQQVEGHVAGVAWRWNAWGFRYEDHERDAKVAEEILKHLEMRAYAHNLVLEGGGIDVDGEGTVIASEATLLNPNRNPDMTREQVEEVLIEYLGVQQVIWLGEGLQDDQTGGQIGNVARFVRPGTVLALTCADPRRSEPQGPHRQSPAPESRAQRQGPARWKWSRSSSRGRCSMPEGGGSRCPMSISTCRTTAS